MKKGHSPEVFSDTSSLKRKQKNLSSSPRSSNIEDLLQQFLVMKNQNNQSDIIQKYGKNAAQRPDFSKEQINSILNISSQGGVGMSKDSKVGNKATMEWSPKYPIKSKLNLEVSQIKKFEKRLISSNMKNRKAQKPFQSINSNMLK